MVYPHIRYQGPAHPDQLSVETTPGTHELDSRTNDGINVSLLWHAEDGRVSITVEDTKTGEAFELTVRDGERALDVFHHPYAYATRRGLSGRHANSTLSAAATS
jgi:hypothetical protein